MTNPQTQILVIMVATIVLFIWGRWRHDLVALTSLSACILVGLVSPESAFLGFGHPAVITVACVLIMSAGLQHTGLIDRLIHGVLPRGMSPLLGMAAFTGLGAVLSAFMNNVGAMALLLPVALQFANRADIAPSRMLMPLAFGTILGGMTTLIGTPPNLIVSGFRAASGAGSFTMFDFAPVGASVAVGGLLFILLVGWRLVPARQRKGVEDFDTGAYLAEAKVKEGSRTVGKTLREVEDQLEKLGAQLVGLVRNETRLYAPNPRRQIRAGDALVIEAEPDDLTAVLSGLDLALGDATKPDREEDKQDEGKEKNKDKEEETEPKERSEPVLLQELVLMPGSVLAGRSGHQVQMSSAHGLNLLAVSRQGQRSIRRLTHMRFKAGDLLLLQGTPEALVDFASEYNLVPLASRDIRLPQPGRAIAAGAIMASSILLAALGVLPAPVSFTFGALAMGLTGIIPLRDLYKGVDWPVIVLLAALIPVAGAMSSTGTADVVADALLKHVALASPVIAMVALLVLTMTMSDFMNNAATAAVMCPIALSVAQQLGVNADPFLMAVAIGASCAFLTPIGHQNNTLILGPGGLRFADFWRLGLPMELLVIAISIPLLLTVWPF